MTYEFDHVHIKAPDPGETANWYVKAFNFKIVSDTVRVFGDRFIRTQTANGIIVNISGARTGEQMGPADSSVHYGLEHFGFKVGDIDAEVQRLTGLGAKLLDAPLQLPNGPQIAFLEAPDEVRVELSMADRGGPTVPELDHVHLRAPDPGKTLDWYLKAFNFTVEREVKRPGWGRAIRCQTVDGATIIISAPRDGQQPGRGDAGAHWGLEHYGIKIDDMDAEVKRLTGMGAELVDGPIDVPGGPRIAFIKAPDDVRIEILQHTA